LRKHSSKDEYINPHFLQTITGALWDFYECEDDEIDVWVIDMFGR